MIKNVPPLGNLKGSDLAHLDISFVSRGDAWMSREAPGKALFHKEDLFGYGIFDELHNRESGGKWSNGGCDYSEFYGCYVYGCIQKVW